jgi:protein-L-isoaspartate(D-aspartate) O-methyltransferase
MTAKRPGFPAKLPAGATPAPKKIAAHAVPAGLAGTFPSQNAPVQGLGLDSHAVRARMVRRLAADGIADSLVLQAMGEVERHRFVDSALVNQAYEDTSLPIGLAQTISKPSVVARMVELMLGGKRGADGRLGRVLEIGTGCGYQAAVLARVAREVYSIERLRGLHDKARDNLRHFRLANVHLLFGDGMAGYARGAPYAGIIAAAGGEAIPQAWVDQLADGARIVAPMVGPGGTQSLVVLEKSGMRVQQSVLEGVHFVPLKSGIA